MLWIIEMEMVESVDDLKSSRSITGTPGPDFELLDARIASVQNTRFKKKVSLEEMKACKEDRFFRERQIAYLIYEYLRITRANGSVENYADLYTVVLRNDNIQEVATRWDEVLRTMSKNPSDDILESLCKLRIRESAQLKTVLELYDLKIHQKISMPNNQELKTMTKRRKDQNLRLRNFDARHGRIATGAVVKNRKGTSGVEGRKGTCYQWKEKNQCSKGDQCSFRHESNDRAQKPEPLPPHLPSHPSDEVEVCRRKDVSKAKGTMVPFSDNRADII